MRRHQAAHLSHLEIVGVHRPAFRIGRHELDALLVVLNEVYPACLTRRAGLSWCGVLFVLG